MFKPTVMDKLAKRMELKLRPVLIPVRRSQLKSTDFQTPIAKRALCKQDDCFRRVAHQNYRQQQTTTYILEFWL